VAVAALWGCGGEAARPPAAAPGPSARRSEPVVETADLSPVARPPAVFLVARLKRPTKLVDTVARWAGVPVGLRDLLPFAAKDLDALVVWDAPVEAAVAIAPSGRRGVVEQAFSVGLTGLEAALSVARQQGYDVRRVAPQIYSVGGTMRLTCAISPSLGATSARLVCGRRSADLEDLLPYMTRGLPTEAIGQHDLEVELKAEPLRQRFASEIAGARLFAGLAVRELALDAPRFDRALSDVAYAGADELVALAQDLDTLRLQASVDEQKRVIDADLSVTLSGGKSFSARWLEDNAKHRGGAPDEFFSLPADAEGGGYSTARDPRLFAGVKAGVTELADAYLEHEKIGKVTRDRVVRVLGLYLGLDGATVNAEGSATGDSKDKKPGSPGGSWTIMRLDEASPLWRGLAADVAGILGDRALRAVLARRLKTDDKSLPTARLVPLRGAGIPGGTQAVVLKLPKGVGALVGRSFGLGTKGASGDGPMERVMAIAPQGSDVLVGVAENPKELTTRLVQALAGKHPTLATRPELAPMRGFNAHAAGFTTLARLLSSFDELGASAPGVVAGLPNHGQVPLFLQILAEAGARPTGTLRLSVPAGFFEDLPGLVPLLAATFMKGLPSAP
jgi:hypothetical protein